ncbi:MAG TPA: hypothetical protein PLI09_15295 [Candidatus Hydrogenedentes bacterium]|nr:hypothetical protein [Candidatus Hydrogenedentota bacterium]
MPTPEFSLPEEVTALIERLAKRSGSSKRVRMDVRRELTAHFQDALTGCPTEEIEHQTTKLIAEFGDPELLGTLIRQAKRRCKSPLERFLSIAIKGTIVILLLALGAALVQGWLAERDFQQGMAALDKKGFISNCSQLRSPHPKDTEYYSGPINKSAAAFLLGLPKQAVKLLVDHAKLIEKFQTAPEERAALTPDIRTWVSANQPLLDQARAAAALPPTPMEQIVAITRLEGMPDQVTGPEIEAMDLIEGLLLESWVYFIDGRVDDAVSSCETALQLIEHLRDFPQLISQMIAISLESDTFQILSWMHDPNLFSEAHSARLLPHTLRAEYERTALAQALCANSLGGRKLFHSGEGFLESGSKPLSLRATNWFFAHLYFSPLFRFLSAPDELGYFEWFDKAAQCLNGPYYTMEDCRQKIPSAKQIPRTQMLTRIIGVNITPDILVEQTFSEARAALLRTILRLEQYKRAHGTYPSELVTLPAEAFPDFYTDPFTGKPLTYTLSGDTFQLFSLGPDGKDSSGAPDGDDIVWGK